MKSQSPVSPQVLIVDDSRDSRGVLTAILQSRGIRTIETTQPRRGLEMLRRFRPVVTILDLDAQDESPLDLQQAYSEATGDPGSSLVILGAARCSANGPQNPHLVCKPYHYAPLIRKIEQLVEQVQTD